MRYKIRRTMYEMKSTQVNRLHIKQFNSTENIELFLPNDGYNINEVLWCILYITNSFEIRFKYFSNKTIYVLQK